MGDTERIVDVGVVPVDELLDERGVVVLLARVEPEVFEELDLRSQSGQLLPYRSEVPAGVRRPLGPAQMGACGDAGTVLDEIVQRRQGGTDPEVVGDGERVVGTRPERHVEVDPDQHAGPVEIGKVAEEGQAVQQRIVRFFSIAHHPLVAPPRTRCPTSPDDRPPTRDRPTGWRTPTRCRTSLPLSPG